MRNHTHAARSKWDDLADLEEPLGVALLWASVVGMVWVVGLETYRQWYVYQPVPVTILVKC